MGCFVSEFVDHNSLKWKKLGPFSFNKAVFRSYQFSTLIAENHSLPVIQDYEIYVHGFFFFVSTSKVFRKILIFFNFYASACPYSSLFFTLWNRMEYTAFCIHVCWLRSVNVIFLIPLRQDKLNQNFLRICLYHCSCRMADNRSSFPEGPNRKTNLFAIMQCSHGKTKAPLFVLLLKARKDLSTKGR